MNPTHSQEVELMIKPHFSNVSSNLSPNLDLDVPITIRKGVRSCTQHPISKFISYFNITSSFFVFTSNMSSVMIPELTRH